MKSKLDLESLLDDLTNENTLLFAGLVRAVSHIYDLTDEECPDCYKKVVREMLHKDGELNPQEFIIHLFKEVDLSEHPYFERKVMDFNAMFWSNHNDLLN